MNGMKFIILIFSLLTCLNANAREAPERAGDVCPIKVGQALPRLMLTDIAGKAFDLNKAVAEQPTILVFYRGSWCPYCNTHLGEMQTIEKPLRDLGYQIIAISPDLPKNLAASVAKNTLQYQLLADTKAIAAQALGLAFRVDDATNSRYLGLGIDLEKASGEKHRLLPVPAAIVLDTSGSVRFVFSSPDYKVRVNTRVLQAAAETALAR